MQDNLERLIRLQDLATVALTAQHQIDETPARKLALEERLAEHERQVNEAMQLVADNHAARRATEKDLAAVQTRLSHFKNQLMQVKTNREYQAMQKEMANAEQEIQEFEDVLLKAMITADELDQTVIMAKQVLTSEQQQVTEEQAELEREQQGLQKELDHTTIERGALVKDLEPSVLALFEDIARGRGGIALTEARDGLCNVCHVRLRPQVYNEVRKNDGLHRCENCQRILYFVPPAAQRS